MYIFISLQSTRKAGLTLNDKVIKYEETEK